MLPNKIAIIPHPIKKEGSKVPQSDTSTKTDKAINVTARTKNKKFTFKTVCFTKLFKLHIIYNGIVILEMSTHKANYPTFTFVLYRYWNFACTFITLREGTSLWGQCSIQPIAPPRLRGYRLGMLPPRLRRTDTRLPNHSAYEAFHLHLYVFFKVVYKRKLLTKARNHFPKT